MINIDRKIAIQKWKPVLETVFIDIKYLIPFILEEVSYQLELKQTMIQTESFLENIQENDKLPKFLKNIKIYLLENIPTTYLEVDQMKQYINPMTCEILYKYNEKYLNIKSLQKETIQNFLIDIDFNNVIDKLYDNNPKKYIRKIKLKRLNGH